MIVRVCVFVMLVFAGTLAEETPAPGASPDRHNVRPGEIAASVRSATNPQQSYALYLPSNYAPERLWPIIFVFDPGARGSLPLQLMKNAAERYGYILAGSNNSRNGPWQMESEAAQEMWKDTHAWLSIDDRRVYFAGFSGGARVSAQLAQLCGCAQGVFLNGAGFGASLSPSRNVVFSVFGITGISDFNYPELVELDTQLETLGFRHFLRRFAGEHAWAPAEVWQEAFAWSALLEMEDGRRARDNSFVAAELAIATTRARQQEDNGELSFALQDYRALAKAFNGLSDTAPLLERIHGLENNPAVRARTKQEKAEIDRQRALERDLFRITDALRGSGGDRDTILSEAKTRVRELRQDMITEKRSDSRRVLERVLGGVFIGMLEQGRGLLQAKEYLPAESYFELAAEARPDSSWPHLSLAQCHAWLGDRKAILRDLKSALDKGVSATELAEFVKSKPKLAPLVDSPEYQKLFPGGKQSR